MNYEFEGKLLVFRVLIPVVFGALFGWLLVGRARMSLRDCFFACLTLWAAFGISDLGSRGILPLVTTSFSDGATGWQAREPWMHWAWVAPLAMSLWIAVRWIAERWIRMRRMGFGQGASKSLRVESDGALAGNATRFRLVDRVRLVDVVQMAYWLATIVLLSSLMFPVGEGYADQASKFRYLGLLAMVTSVLNAWLIVQRSEVARSRWFRWVHVGQLGCIAAVVLQSYASLGEWVIFCGAFMAGAVGTTSSGKYTLATDDGSLSIWISFAASAGLCLSQAYAWNPLPPWLLVVLGCMPAIMAVADMGIARSCDRSFGWRIAGCMALLALCMGLLYFFVLGTEPSW